MILENAILGLIELIDRARVSVLRWTLAFPILRTAFYDRAVRNFLLFILAVILYLPLSLYLPLWLLAVGPIVWGLPHVISSLRLQHRMISRSDSGKSSSSIKTTAAWLGGLWLTLAAIRILSDVFGKSMHWDIFHPGLLEGIFSAATLLGLSYILAFDWVKIAFSFAAILALNALIWFHPYAAIGILIIAHNFIAFLYWIEAAPVRRERGYAILAAVIFALIHVAVWFKAFDGLINLMPSADSLPWSGLDINSLGHSITPWSTDPNLWYRSVVLYSFGQALHYFVWLKAIPDIHAPSRVPTSFHTSWVLLTRDIGKKVAIVAIVICAVPITVGLLHHFTGALQIYFAVASYHGYMELAGLGALFGHRVRSL